MNLQANPDYETLKIIVIIAGAVITILLAIVGYFLNKQIKVQENMTHAVTQLTTSVNTMTALDKERYPVTVMRLNSHRDSIKDYGERLTIIETTLKIK